MATASERIPVLVTGAEKARISKGAKAAGLSMGEYLRRAASAYRPSEDEDDAALDGLLTQVRKTTASASAAIDDALAKVAESNKRIEAMERAKTPAGAAPQ
jgi:uncharacterized protein (DUF885 family)